MRRHLARGDVRGPTKAASLPRTLKVGSASGTGCSDDEGLRTLGDRFVAITVSSAMKIDRPETLHCCHRRRESGRQLRVAQ